MRHRITLLAQTVDYPTGGGHFWVYLNWALGLQQNGYDLIWLETVQSQASQSQSIEIAQSLRQRLQFYGLDCKIVFVNTEGKEVPLPKGPGMGTLSEARAADLLINFRYSIPQDFIKSFRRSALVDIDPGLFQHWVHQRQMKFAPHDIHFSISEAVGKPGSVIPDLGLKWHTVRPCVSIESWKPVNLTPDAPMTTVTHWHANEYVTTEHSFYENTKRVAFLSYLDLPKLAPGKMELCVFLDPIDPEYALLKENEWHLIHPHQAVSTPNDYQSYIQSSAGEFSACKPSCIKFQNAWISDRTLCYLASGKPCVVEYTGPISFLPDGPGLHRFKNKDEAAHAIQQVRSNYQSESIAARKIAETYFDAKNITQDLVDTAMELLK